MLKITRLAKNFSLLLIAEDAEIGSGGDNYEDKMVKRQLSKNLNKVINYLITNAR